MPTVPQSKDMRDLDILANLSSNGTLGRNRWKCQMGRLRSCGRSSRTHNWWNWRRRWHGKITARGSITRLELRRTQGSYCAMPVRAAAKVSRC